MDTKQPGPVTRFTLNVIGFAIGLMAVILAISALFKVILFCIKWVGGTC